MPVINKSIHRATVSLNVPKKIADVILYTNNVVQKITNNPNFPTPNPTVAALTAALNELHAAETAALSRTKGTATVRNDKLAVVVSLLQQLGGQVQSVADATPENGAAIIESAGLSVRKITPHGKRAFAAKQGPLGGSAIVTAATAAPRASYEWQYSIDGGKTWVSAPATTQGKTMIVGLPAGTTVQFRYLAVTPKGGQGHGPGSAEWKALLGHPRAMATLVPRLGAWPTASVAVGPPSLDPAHRRWLPVLLLGPALALLLAWAKEPPLSSPPPPPPLPRAALAPSSIPDAADAPPEPAEAQWTRAAKGQTAFDWVRSAGAHAPPLVLRGLVTPGGVLTDPSPLCDAIPLGSRLPVQLNLKLAGKPRPLYVRALARGPLGVSIRATEEGAECATAGASQPLRIDVPRATSDLVELRIGEVDQPGERSGQTFPYVVVLSDEAATPAEQPDERPPLPPRAVTVRWALTPMECPDSACCTCWHASLELRGAVTRTLPLKDPLVGQSGCWPSGTGILCAGASGAGTLSVWGSRTGKGGVSLYGESDGYCPEGEECGSTTELATFTLPPGLQLVPDPLGTFPPAPPVPR